MTLEVSGAPPHMFRLLTVFWDQQEVVTFQNRYHIPHFRATSRNTQGGLISLTLFNFIVNNMVRYWLSLAVENQLVVQEVLLLALGGCLGLLYADNGVVGSRDP